MDAPLSGRPVTVRPGRVTWEGFDLLTAAAVLVEKPIFPWPQPVRFESLPADPDARRGHVAAEREARSLIVSAIRTVAEVRPVLNPPGAGLFAAAPGTALDHASRAKMPVVPWRLEPADPANAGALVLDPVGSDRWHRPAAPPAGDPALVLDPPEGPVRTLLVIGPRIAGAVHHESARAWSSHGVSEGRATGTFDPAAVEVALETAWALELELAAITLTGEPEPRILHIDAAPDLTAWGRATEGRTLDALADRLVTVSR